MLEDDGGDVGSIDPGALEEEEELVGWRFRPPIAKGLLWLKEKLPKLLDTDHGSAKPSDMLEGSEGPQAEDTLGCRLKMLSPPLPPTALSLSRRRELVTDDGKKDDPEKRSMPGRRPG